MKNGGKIFAIQRCCSAAELVRHKGRALLRFFRVEISGERRGIRTIRALSWGGRHFE